MIPAEAVEAAAKYLADFAGTSANNWEWHIDGARELLEAAAPHMLPVQWGVRDRHSLQIAGHPNEESARGTVAARPEWYEVVSRPMPGPWTPDAG